MSDWASLQTDARLALYLPMQDNAASTAILSSRGPNAIYHGANTSAKTVAGPGRGYASALTFNGTSDSASTGVTIDLSGTSKITLMYWARIRGTLGSFSPVVEHSPDFNVAAYRGFVAYHTATRWEAYVNSPGGYASRYISNPAPLDQWRHYAFTIDKSLASAEVQAFFLDGVQAASTLGANINHTDALGNQILYLMARNNSVSRTTGDMAGLRVYTDVLAADEIATIVVGPASVSASAPRILSPYLIGDVG